MSILGSKLRTFRWTNPNPDLILKSAGVEYVVGPSCGPGFNATFPEIDNNIIIIFLRKTDLSKESPCAKHWKKTGQCMNILRNIMIQLRRVHMHINKHAYVQVQVQDLFVTYTIIQRVLSSSEMWVRSAPWTVQYYRKQHKEVLHKWNE